jgi:hypothetical protein
LGARLFQRLASPFREFGWAAGSLYLVDRLLRTVSPRLGLQVYEFMVQPIGGKPLLPPSLCKNLSVQPIDETSPEVARMPAREEIKAQRFRQGARCLGTYRKGELLGYLWYAKDRHQEDEVRCDYVLADAATSVFDFDLCVMPKHRMGLGFLGLWHGANVALAEQGVRHTYSRMTRFNLPSRRAHVRLGARRIGAAVFLQAWGVELMFSTMAPYLALTVGVNQRVKLTLASKRSATRN